MYQILNKNIVVSLILASLAFSMKAMDVEKYNIENHPLMKSENISLLYGLATQVSSIADKNFSAKKQILVGLGQSPAYLLEMIKLIDQKKNKNDRSYLNVAFSGSYYSFSDDDKSVIDPFLCKKFIELGSHYKQYLNKVGLSDNDMNKDDTEFIILEVCQHGNGLKSFLSFFHDYKKQPNVIYLQSNFFEPVHLPVKNQWLAMNEQEGMLTVALANADKFKDRITPQFQFHKWQTVDPREFQPEENTPKILKRLQWFTEKNC